jgi:hypothetical protein
VDVRHVKLSRVRASSRPTDSSAELLGSLPRRAAAADRARVAPILIYPCLGAARHDPANSHLHRVSPLADVHRTQHEDLGLSPRPSGGPKSVEARLAIPSLRRRDLTFRACDFRAKLCSLVQRAEPRCSCYAEAWVAGGGDHFLHLPEGPPGPGLARSGAVRQPGRLASMHGRVGLKVGV